VGETAALDLSGECGGGKTPPQISRRKDQVPILGSGNRRKDLMTIIDPSRLLPM